MQVKSPNILLTGGNKPYAKLGDVGLARMPGLYAASMDDKLKGTFNWLAPEMILNDLNHEVRLCPLPEQAFHRRSGEQAANTHRNLTLHPSPLKLFPNH